MTKIIVNWWNWIGGKRAVAITMALSFSRPNRVEGTLSTPATPLGRGGNVLNDLIQSVPIVQQSSTVLPKESVAQSLTELLPFFRKHRDSRYHLVSQLNVTEAEREQVIQWFRSLQLPLSPVDIFWIAQGEGISLPLDLFFSYFDSLWFPSSHDVVVLDKEHRFLIELNHEEMFSYWVE